MNEVWTCFCEQFLCSPSLVLDDILRPSGETLKCLDTYYESFLISDELRKCLLMPEEPCYHAFSSDDRKEFIFHVFKALCLGGRLCQFEDFVEPYMECTKLIYKDLVRWVQLFWEKERKKIDERVFRSVTKNPATGKLQVASQVYKITNAASSVSPLFPIEHPQNFMYVSIDPVRRYVNVWYHASDTYYWKIWRWRWVLGWIAAVWIYELGCELGSLFRAALGPCEVGSCTTFLTGEALITPSPWVAFESFPHLLWPPLFSPTLIWELTMASPGSSSQPSSPPHTPPKVQPPPLTRTSTINSSSSLATDTAGHILARQITNAINEEDLSKILSFQHET